METTNATLEIALKEERDKNGKARKKLQEAHAARERLELTLATKDETFQTLTLELDQSKRDHQKALEEIRHHAEVMSMKDEEICDLQDRLSTSSPATDDLQTSSLADQTTIAMLRAECMELKTQQVISGSYVYTRCSLFPFRNGGDTNPKNI